MRIGTSIVSEKHEMDISLFPTTRYQGSKRKLLPWIYEAVRDKKFRTALDGFGGTGSVSYLFKTMGKAVTYNDMLRFNYLIGKALVENSGVTLLKPECVNLLRQQKNAGKPRLIEKHFKDVFFLPHENRWLDQVVANIYAMDGIDKLSIEFKRAIGLFAVFQACMIKRPFNLFHRRNLSLRIADVERSFGNKTSWDRPFDEYFTRFVAEANNSVFDSGQPCRAQNKSLMQIDASEYDLIYIDPPYLNQKGSSETSDYLRCYHFLEGIANYSQWESLINHADATHRLDLPNTNDFRLETIHETFEEILHRFRKSIVVLSYKKHGIPSTDYLMKLVKKFKKKVSSRSVHYKYALNSQNGEAERNREVLIVGE
jgi:adenine-specific DNA methylase